MKQRNLLIFILGLLSAIGPFSIDMYLPAFPSIASDLNASIEQISYSLSSFFIGICAGQLLIGPILDRYGRKLPLYVGLSLYLVASLLCAWSTTVDLLIAARFLQALGCCVAMVAPRAIVRDSFPVHESAKIFSLLILILGVSPIIAPSAGSLLIGTFHWSSIFYAMIGITASVLLAVIFFLPETKPADPSFSLKPGPILRGFASVIRHPQFFTYSVTGALSGAGLFAYLAGSPFIFMEYFKVSQAQYGYIFALIAAGLITASQLNNLVLKKYKSEQVVLMTLTVQTTVGLLLCIGSVLSLLDVATTIVLLAIFLSCQGFSFPNSAALSLAPFKREAGTASALMGALQMAMGALASALVGILHDNTTLPMSAVMATCASTGLLILIFARRRAAARPGIDDIDEQAFEQVENT